MLDWYKRKKRRKDVDRPQYSHFDQSLFEKPGQTLYQSLSKSWSDSDSDYSVSKTAQCEIREIEQRYNLRIPEDFSEYLIHAAPSAVFMDSIGTQWWPISEVKNIPDECGEDSPGKVNDVIENEREKYLIFSDFLVWCYAWAICCSESENRGKIALIGGEPDHFVAGGFRQFLAMELNDSIEIH